MKRRFPDRPQKPHLLKVNHPSENSFLVKDDIIAWNNPWHFHPEIELLYCISGRGTNFVGNHISPIEEGELLLFGRNLPHTRQRDKEYYMTHPGIEPETIVVQFREEFLGDAVASLNEFRFMASLMSRARRGMKFFGTTRDNVATALRRLKELTGLPALLQLIQILDELGQSEDYTFLNHAGYLSDLDSQDASKIDRVFAYVRENFRQTIPLAVVADLTNLSPTAFCRYFKSRTRRSFLEYLAETRINYACLLLMEGQLDVTQVCFASGFNNLSNFNKQFKKIMHVTPGTYRHRAQQKSPVG